MIVATKGGHTRDGEAWELDGRPEHIRAACEASLKALETDRIDLYQYHRPDPNVPYAETIGAFKELQDEGKVRWIGISNANVEQIEEARSIVDLVSVQNQLSLEYPSPLDQGRGRAVRASTGSRSCRGRRSAASRNAADAAGDHDPVQGRRGRARRLAAAGRAGVAARRSARS